MTPATFEEARAAKDRARQELVTLAPLINGIGVTKVNGEWAVSVHLSRHAPPNSLPARIDGVRVVFDVVGEAGTYGG